eukprot:TRINITY_DN31336_c0_g1_i1.p1 TRINITY_DN31336_c0_g1~~TRINITY_DN31336_c0_g1_i1.p1  ORF type:complete len:384 (+),score=57.87 TRINITY_DN31336_c0_g1_i1:71-1153(+)
MPSYEQRRLFYLHSTIRGDPVSVKSKTWNLLETVYGMDRAQLLMPLSFDLTKKGVGEKLKEYCTKLLQDVNVNPEDTLFVIKNPVISQQKGIWLAFAKDLVHSAPENENFTFVTKLLPRTRVIGGRKVIVRQFLVVACHKGKTYGYVHRNGKCNYTPKPYRQPGNYLKDVPVSELNSKIPEIFNDTISQAYVFSFDDEQGRRRSPLELYEDVRANGGDPSFFERSMATRLGLVLSASLRGEHSYVRLCESSDEVLSVRNPDTKPIPRCLKDSIRFHHWGCDFHVDEKFSGWGVGLLESKKGPYMKNFENRVVKLKKKKNSVFYFFFGFFGDWGPTDNERAKKFNMKLKKKKKKKKKSTLR